LLITLLYNSDEVKISEDRISRQSQLHKGMLIAGYEGYVWESNQKNNTISYLSSIAIGRNYHARRNNFFSKSPMMKVVISSRGSYVHRLKIRFGLQTA
jgi:hypothetical protein